MFWFKSCPKCNTGDLYSDEDRFGKYVACLQCGHSLSVAEEVVLRYLTGDSSSQGSQGDSSRDTASSHRDLARVS
jgi:DNA-directed RNA polymerase subunit M/transcription elongation factor TFIIS